MKRMKKLVSILLAMAMTVMMATTVFAQAGKTTYEKAGTITINDAESGQTYNAYQILYLESYSGVSDKEADKDELGNPTGGNYVYKVTDAWEGFFTEKGSMDGVPVEEGPGLTYVNIDAQGYVTWKTNANVVAFARAAQAWAKTNKITATATQKVDNAADGQAPTKNNTVSFSQLDLGYYLVDTTLGTLCSLDTTNPNVTMEEKNESPTNEKKVQEDSKTELKENEWGSVNDADVGQTVNFKSTITVKSGAENYTFHDRMDEGLTWDGTVAVKVGGNKLENTENAGYTLVTPTSPATALTDGCTFEIRFNQEYIAALAEDTQIVIEYSATVNQKAVVGGTGNQNESHVEYGDRNNTTTTPPSTTTTYTWEFEIFKYANGEGKIKDALEGAEFALETTDNEKAANRLKFHKITVSGTEGEGTAGYTEDVYKLCTDETCQDTDTFTHATTFETNKSGLIKLQGLDSGTYYLHEVKAPEGYNKLAGPIKVTIIATTDETGKSATASIYRDYKEGETNTPVADGKIEILNQTGSELPSTGGIGTTIFYVLGAILFVGAGVLLVVKKRMNTEK